MYQRVQLVCTRLYLMHNKGPRDEAISTNVIIRDELQLIILLCVRGLPKNVR